MRTIIFDFGNVIAFFHHERTLARLAFFTDMPTDEMFQAIYCGPLEAEFETGRISVAEFLSEVRRICRLQCDEGFMHDAFAHIFDPNPEVCDLIGPLKKSGYRLLLGSNTNKLHSDYYLHQYADALSQFDDFILSCRIGVCKPNAGFFEDCLRLANCPAAECLFVDDMPVNIAGARKMGMQGLVYAPGNNLAGQLRRVWNQYNHGIGSPLVRLRDRG